MKEIFEICDGIEEFQCANSDIRSFCPSRCGYDASTTIVLNDCNYQQSTTLTSTLTSQIRVTTVTISQCQILECKNRGNFDIRSCRCNCFSAWSGPSNKNFIFYFPKIILWTLIACNELNCDTEFDVCETYSQEQCSNPQIYYLCPSVCGYDFEETTVIKPCANSPSITSSTTTTTTRLTTRNQIIATIQTTIVRIREYLSNFFNKLFNLNSSGWLINN